MWTWFRSDGNVLTQYATIIDLYNSLSLPRHFCQQTLQVPSQNQMLCRHVWHARWLKGMLAERDLESSKLWASTSKQVSALGPLSSRIPLTSTYHCKVRSCWQYFTVRPLGVTGHILCGQVAIITKLSPHYVPSESTISSLWHSNGTRSSTSFSPQLWEKIWE